MKLYRVTDSPTLDGEAAGPGTGNYLEFVPGDIVVIVRKERKGVVQAVRLKDNFAQELDKSSLEMIGFGLKLNFELDSWSW